MSKHAPRVPARGKELETAGNVLCVLPPSGEGRYFIPHLQPILPPILQMIDNIERQIIPSSSTKIKLRPITSKFYNFCVPCTCIKRFLLCLIWLTFFFFLSKFSCSPDWSYNCLPSCPALIFFLKGINVILNPSICPKITG